MLGEFDEIAYLRIKHEEGLKMISKTAFHAIPASRLADVRSVPCINNMYRNVCTPFTLWYDSPRRYDHDTPAMLDAKEDWFIL